MFYYQTVLQHHTGCFSTIWLAATRGIRITRREFLKVNVKRTCKEIQDFVTGQVPSLQPNQSKPRFSLYLSSQLQYGVVVVYHKQCGFLLEETQQIIDRLIRSKSHVQIDMPDADRMVMDLVDCLNGMEEAESAQDPFFGLMESHELPSPNKLHQVEVEMCDLQHSLVPGPHMTSSNQSLSSPAAAITLKEQEPFVINAAECFEGDDLPEVTARDIDLLMDQPDPFRREEDGEKADGTGEQGLVSSINPLKETMVGAEQDSERLQDEETGQPVELPLKAISVERTPPHVAMPSEIIEDEGGQSPCEGVGVPPVKKHRGRRRRQLVFVDLEVQMSDKEMQEQIVNQKTETNDLFEVLLNLSSLTHHVAPAQLFSAPCGPLLHPDLLLLWKQHASLAILPESEEVLGAGGESEQDMEVLRDERKRRHSRMKETSSESGLQPSEGPSEMDVVLDMSKNDRSGSDVITPASRWSPQVDANPSMEPIAEENIEMPEAETLASRNSLSWISSILQRLEVVTFDSVLPPEADRSAAAQMLYKLLEMLSAHQLTAHQTDPYSDIIIRLAAPRVVD
ncbi:REC8 meiotic recombination protein b isoform X1 [Nothobranchius furzeri]|uniref:REC8 meiotic recombination protein b n=4 Tax=Nothobranchius furzeri TaxID=105023 RepID=A0A8C6KVA4_NOTFU|nr:transcript variant X1 [Nothobranchius furzeri]